LNNLKTEVDQTITVAGEPVRLNLPAGPYVRVTAFNAVASFVNADGSPASD